MRLAILILTLAIVCLTLNGCLFYSRSESTSSNLAVTDPNLAERITVGQSTTADIERLYGKPHSSDTVDGRASWSYGSTITEETGWCFLFFFGHKGKHTRHEKLTFVFDETGVLQEMQRG